MRRAFVVIAIFAIGIAGALSAEDAPPIESAIETTQAFDWVRVRPLDLLAKLKVAPAKTFLVDYTNLPPRGWIREEDVARLMMQISSTEPASPVFSEIQGPAAPAQSTVGNEAMYLIEGYKKRKYPPTQGSTLDFRPVADDYRAWWRTITPGSLPSRQGGAYTVKENSPTRAEILSDAKPWDLSLADELLYKKESIVRGAASTAVLVNRLTGKVSYVWANPYRKFILPKYIMPNVQVFYDRTHS